MLLALPLTLLLSQGLIASAYVVLEENGYYSTWRSNPMQNQWPMFLSPQSYLPFLQNFNPFSWGRPQQSFEQEDREMKTMKMRQMALYNMIKCVIVENEKDACKKTLERAMILFEETDVVLESVENKPVVIESTIWQVKPAVTQMKPMDETSAVQKKPMVIEEPPVPIAKPMQILIVEKTKPMEVKPVEAKPVEEMKPPPMMTELVLPLAGPATVGFLPPTASVQEVPKGNPELVEQANPVEEMKPPPVMTELVLPLAGPATVGFSPSIASMQEVEPQGNPELVEKAAEEENPMKTDAMVAQNSPVAIEPTRLDEKVEKVESVVSQEKPMEQPVTTEVQLDTTDGKPVIKSFDVRLDQPIDEEPLNLVKPVEPNPAV